MDVIHPLSRVPARLLAIFIFQAFILMAQASPGIVARRGAEVRGTIDGPLQVAEGGTVTIAPGGSITGELVVPAEKNRQNASTTDRKVDAGKSSKRTVVDNQGAASAARGGVKESENFELPHVHAPKQKGDGRRQVMNEEYVANLDFASIKDFTVDHRRARVTLPPDTYGRFVVNQGSLVLGAAGARQVMRYDFQKLDVGAGARVEVLSPVVVFLGEGSVWRGSLGERKTFWLDARVADGAVELAAGGEFHGHLSAPRSSVTFHSRAVFTGGLTSDQLVVAEGAKVSAEAVVWDGGPAERLAATGAHRALKLQREIPKFKVVTRGRYFPGVSYIEDVPYIMLAAGGGAPSDDTSALEREAVFEAFRLPLVECGFARAGIVLTNSSGAEAAPGVRNLALTRVQFEAISAELAGKAEPALNVQFVRSDPALLNTFLERVLALSRSAGAPTR